MCTLGKIPLTPNFAHRYLALTHLNLIKKKAVAEWKQEQLTAKRQQQDDILVGEILNPDEAAARDRSVDHSEDLNGERRPLSGGSEKDRAAAKARIAQWRAAQARQIEEEKVLDRRIGYYGNFLTDVYEHATGEQSEGSGGRCSQAGGRGRRFSVSATAVFLL
jgi:hypothetical protein